MLRYLLYPLVRFALWVFFRKIEVRGREQVPRGRPLVLVANHPNVMLDVLLLGAFAPGPFPRFLGKTTLFKNTFYTFFLRRLGGIPVARSQDPGGQVGRNQEMLREACQTLVQGDSLALFPEGLSRSGLRLRPFKPGAARIALRAEDESGGQAGIWIVPVGLTYTAPGIFRSEVVLHFGAPVQAGDFLTAYRANHGQGAQQLTDLLYQRLLPLTLHLENPDLEEAIHDLVALYGEEVLQEFPDSPERHRRLLAGQELIRAAQYYARTNPALVRVLATRLRHHLGQLRRLDLEPKALSPGKTAPGPWHLFLTLLLAPLALYGLLNNALPYVVPRLWTRAYAEEPEMWATVKLAVGIVAFPLYYALRMGVAYWFWGWSLAFEYGLTLPLSGLFALYYKERLLERWPLWQQGVAPHRRRYLLHGLAREHHLLLADLDQLKEHYLTLPPEEVA
ncbi:MAG: 1-acyl-sn-glycerol-3-phosphate acyltransferase [Candidatus Handelsmanbacteria bacterium]|nr:1-acyl-sn-glycerol-3-phosphate acyltransferase [Candidatus Handelsmanbacteria bacterium]